MAVLLVGIISLALGGVGIYFWWGYFLGVLRGSIPLLFALFGLAAIAVGISSVKDKAASTREEEEKKE